MRSPKTKSMVDIQQARSTTGYTQGDSIEEIRQNVREAFDCYFDETMDRPNIIRLHFVHDEIMVA
ncbi:MAG: 2-oxoisovalerate dehydrogenase [Gammaproteobacteria bacterium]|nr:2-oxoisovalerate dehydrogenase [Gammaproteobacteria bacterium]